MARRRRPLADQIQRIEDSTYPLTGPSIRASCGASSSASAATSRASPAIGITTKGLNQIVRGRALPSVDTAVKFAFAVDAKPAFIWQMVSNYVLDKALGRNDLTADYL